LLSKGRLPIQARPVSEAVVQPVITRERAMKRIFALSMLSLMVACGGTLEAEPQEEGASLSTIESALMQCGWGCPSGYHPISYLCGYGCSSSCSGSYYNATSCDPNSGSSFNSCGLSCPSGYHPDSYSYVGYCELGKFNSSTSNNQTACVANSSSGFYTCGIGCPAGYRALSYSVSYFCVISKFGLPNGNNRTYCAP
jgi:hypothetical protein